MMKCPYCNKEIKEVREKQLFGVVLPNWIPPAFIIGMITIWLLPFDINHGYAMEYDMLIAIGFMLLYLAYLIAYVYGKVKGTFVLYKKGDE